MRLVCFMWCCFRFITQRRTVIKNTIPSPITNLARLDFKLPSTTMFATPQHSSLSVDQLTEKVAQLKVVKTNQQRVKIDKAAARMPGKPGNQVEKRLKVLETVDEIPLDVFIHRTESVTIEQARRVVRQLEFIPYNLVEVAAVSPVDPTHPFVTKCYPLTTNEVGGRYKKNEALPFPTMFWMCSPELHSKIGNYEVEGLVNAFEERLRSSPEYLAQMEKAHKSYAEERWAQLTEEEKEMVEAKGWAKALRDKGVAGIHDFTTVKCLHTHYAHFLARPEHGNVLGQWVHELLEKDRKEGLFAL